MVDRSMSCGRGLLAAAALAAVGLAAVLGIGARGWIGRPFPGFFVLPNRVVASIALPGWRGGRDGAIYQHTVVALDGQPVTSAAEIYRRVAERPAGTPFSYSLRAGTATETVTIASATFAPADYWAIFGAYLGTGIAYLALGFLGAWLLADATLGRALFVLGGIGGLYTLSAIDLYGPTGSMRVHALAESFLAAAMIDVALRLPRRELGWAPTVTRGAWWMSLSLAIAYQLALMEPGAYSAMHAAAEGSLGVAGLLIIGVLLAGGIRIGDRAHAAVRAGALLGLGVPTVMMGISSLSGGQLPVNLCAATAFLFPLCFGWGLVRARLTVRDAGLDPDASVWRRRHAR